MRFLFLNRFFRNSHTPTARMAADVVEELTRMGHEVTVVVVPEHYVRSAAEKRDWEPSGIRLRRLRVRLRNRTLDWIAYWLSALPHLASNSWDRAVLMTDPPFLPFAAWLTRCSRSGRRKVFWWTMDLYPEALVAAGLVSERSFLNKLLRQLNERGLRQLAGIITLGPRQLARVQAYENTQNPAVTANMIPPWDLRQIDSVPKSENMFLSRLGLQNTKVALYAGNLGEGHLVLPLITAARKLAEQQRRDWAFLFACHGAGRKLLDAAAKELQNIHLMDYVSEEETSHLLCAATVHLITMKPGWDGVIVPSKLYGILQTTAPVLFIGPTQADTALSIQALDRGLSIPAEASEFDIIQALDRLAELKSSCKPVRDDTGPGKVARFLSA